MSLNVEKTKCMIFRNINKHVEFPPLYMNGTVIEYVEEFKFLGFIIDKHLSWKAHIDYIHKKILSGIGTLHRSKKFFPVQIKVKIYHALIHSYLNSGIILWGHKSLSEKAKLVIAQRKAIRSIYCLGYNAHTSEHFKSLNIVKLKDLLLISRVNFYCKFKMLLLPRYLQNLEFRINAQVHEHDTIHKNDLHSVHGHPDCLQKVIPAVIKNLPYVVKRKIELMSPIIRFSISSIIKLLKSLVIDHYTDPEV